MRTFPSLLLIIAWYPSFGRAFLATKVGAHLVVPDNVLTSFASSSTQLFGDLAAARRNVGAGMQSFRLGRIQESIDYFDKAQAAEPQLDPFLWQRGLSYYYANEFDKASQQFRRDVKVNPLDVEEIVWDIASQMRRHGIDASFPLTTALRLPPNQSDRRPIMSVVYKLFQGTADEQALAQAGHGTGRPSDEFYSLLYLGLFAEAVRRDATKAENYMRQAIHTEYAQTTGQRDYMTDVARMHCQLRGWGI